MNDVWVKGLPHNTVIIIRWSATDEFPDGSPRIHIVRMRWGKSTEIDAAEDSEAVANMLKRQAAGRSRGSARSPSPQLTLKSDQLIRKTL